MTKLDRLKLIVYIGIKIQQDMLELINQINLLYPNTTKAKSLLLIASNNIDKAINILQLDKDN